MMKDEHLATYLTDLTEEQIDTIKNNLIAEQIIFETKKVNDFDIKFFETVTISNTLIKFCLFFSIGVYLIINLAGIILAIVKDTIKNPLNNIVGLLAICVIVVAIFSNIPTNKKKEENALYIKGNNFIFNFNNGVTATPHLFYALPSTSLQKIEFIIYCLKKGQIFGGVTFTFKVLDYVVQHQIRYTNLTAIENLIHDKFSLLSNSLVIDGKGATNQEPTKHKQKLKYNLMATTALITALLLFVIPYALNYRSLALTIAAAIQLVTAILSFLANWLYTYHLVPGLTISAVFIIIGFLVPLLVIETSGLTFFNYLLQNSEILLPTVFGIIGLCLYAYSMVIIGGKIGYKLKNKK